VLYRFLHLILRFWLRIHFKRIFISGFANIPEKGPAILACNHPNSFLDAIVIALLAKRPIHFLVRSDVFRKAWAKWILGKLNMIPIYRLQEGLENLEKNQGTFKICNDILSRGQILLIFSEGNCVLEKRLRPLKKGTARIAFGAEELHQFNLNLKIVPVALNYVHPATFRTEIMITAAAPFSINDLYQTWQHEPARAIRMFNERLAPALEKNLLVIPDKHMEKQAEIMLDLSRNWLNYPLFKTYFHGTHRIEKEQQWIRTLFLESKEPWPERVVKFKQAANRAGIPVHACIPGKRTSSLLIIAGLIPTLLTLIIHLFPVLLSARITRKSVKSEKFRSSVLFGTGAIITYLWYLIWLLALGLINWKLMPLVFLFPWMALLGLFWWESLQTRRWSIQLAIFEKQSPEVFDKWKQERDRLMHCMM
jgi:glycerol-3-phosphate O-acyltransferase / dihydroxyacetone phosphate acyltransferase